MVLSRTVEVAGALKPYRECRGIKKSMDCYLTTLMSAIDLGKS